MFHLDSLGVAIFLNCAVTRQALPDVLKPADVEAQPEEPSGDVIQGEMDLLNPWKLTPHVPDDLGEERTNIRSPTSCSPEISEIRRLSLHSQREALKTNIVPEAKYWHVSLMTDTGKKFIAFKICFQAPILLKIFQTMYIQECGKGFGSSGRHCQSCYICYG